MKSNPWLGAKTLSLLLLSALTWRAKGHNPLGSQSQSQSSWYEPLGPPAAQCGCLERGGRIRIGWESLCACLFATWISSWRRQLLILGGESCALMKKKLMNDDELPVLLRPPRNEKEGRKVHGLPG
ncbi:hypothetical protein SETIT_2G406000v2 [Setaria italica]|uniref:Uncharacterized protein n=1 Tax=Setaria italica TaxID=4555 RepID=A0A368Q860_SETIT|nr:hypothetical protein SETIT_2G406000v2 [Setaria italica]